MKLPTTGWMISSLLALGLCGAAIGADWPQWRGQGRLGVWAEDGVLERFPAGGLEVSWRRPIARGYSGPAVADGRVFITEFVPTTGSRGTESAVALDESTGEELWRVSWEADYAGLQYDLGPRATPTVDSDRVYVLGAAGNLLCLEAASGKRIWAVDYRKDFDAMLPTWGFVGAPLVDGPRLIALVGGLPDAKVVAFDKLSGEELWRSLSGKGETGYAPPTIIEAGRTRQLIIWHPQAVHSLDPETGRVLWEQPFHVEAGLSVATPVWSEHGLLVSSFYNGSRLYRLDPEKPAAELLWKGASDSEINTDGLHSLVTTPVVQGDYIYGVGSYGHLRCLDAQTGRRVWESLALTGENARWASAQIVRQGERYVINNDRGELIIAELSPEGYNELDRIELMEPTQPSRRRRALGAVHWTHPAYANQHMIIRNDHEIVRWSLAAEEEVEADEIRRR